MKAHTLAPLGALALALFLASASEPLGAATLLVANKSDDTVDLIDVDSGASRATLPTGNAPHEIAVSPDGKTAVVTDYGDREAPGSSLTVVDIAGAKVLATVDLGEHTRPHGAVWLSPNRVAVTAEGSGHLLVVDPLAGTVLSATETGQEVSHMLAVTPDGRRGFVANIRSNSVTVIDLETGRKLRDIATGEGAEGIAVTPDGKEVWVSNRGADTLSVVDAASLEILATLPCPGFPIRVAITPDGSRALVSSARSGEVSVFDVAERKEILRRKLDRGSVSDEETRLFAGRFGESPVPIGTVISPDGKRAWIAATMSDVVVVVAPETLDVQGLLEAGREPDGIAYSPIRVGDERDQSGNDHPPPPRPSSAPT